MNTIKPDNQGNILAGITDVTDLHKIPLADLPRLADEIREFIIHTVSATGGHLAANLGAVELTIALLKVFQPPHDKIVWDVSHQTYTYKILTGRRDRFHTLRQTDGISGFLSRAESPCDTFGAGHAGTALSAALGLAAARDQRQSDEHIIAVAGDGALGCGCSFEALNNLLSTTKRLIVVLNDNEMSISANVGAIAHYLGELLANPRYNRWKSSVERVARDWLGLGWLRRIYMRTEEAVKSLFLHSVIFEKFGLRYIGPINGHNFRSLINALELAKRSDEPILLHVTTQKGRGYPFAEQAPEVWHGTGAFECATGRQVQTNSRLRYSEIFGKTVLELAARHEKLIAITAAMATGTGLTEFARRYPDRFFDVGIAEEHAVVFAAGLATQGFMPIVALYSTFSQRVVDYIIHDVCLQKLPVIFCLDRAGIVGDDGPTHHGIFDITLLRATPNLIIAHPRDEAELVALMHSAITWQQPTVIRYPRGCGPGTPIPTTLPTLAPGEAEIVRPGDVVQIWALGDMLPMAETVAQHFAEHNIQIGIVNPRFVKPLDTTLLAQHQKSARLIITLENSMLAGGFGSAIAEWLADNSTTATPTCRLLRFGWPDRFIPHGATDVLYERHEFTPSTIMTAIRKALT